MRARAGASEGPINALNFWQSQYPNNWYAKGAIRHAADGGGGAGSAC
jgi:hypothetical protein